MSSNFVKRHNAIGWDWYLVTDEASSWVSHMVKEHIEQLEAENAKLRELAWRLLEVERIGATSAEWHELLKQASELGVEVK